MEHTINIYSSTKDYVGFIEVTDIGLRITFADGSLVIPKTEIRSANIERIGSIAQNLYVLRIYVIYQTAVKLKNYFAGLQTKTQEGKKFNGKMIANHSGEWVEFFINPYDVMGYDQKETPRGRQILDQINAQIKPL